VPGIGPLPWLTHTRASSVQLALNGAVPGKAQWPKPPQLAVGARPGAPRPAPGDGSAVTLPAGLSAGGRAAVRGAHGNEAAGEPAHTQGAAGLAARPARARDGRHLRGRGAQAGVQEIGQTVGKGAARRPLAEGEQAGGGEGRYQAQGQATLPRRAGDLAPAPEGGREGSTPGEAAAAERGGGGTLRSAHGRGSFHLSFRFMGVSAGGG
jgi:translation initiation factor IF-2